MKRLFFQLNESKQFNIIINECGFVLDSSLDSRFDGWMVKNIKDLKPGIKPVCIDTYLEEETINYPIIRIEQAEWNEIHGADKWDDMTEEEIIEGLGNPENQQPKTEDDIEELFKNEK